ncbi:MAG TPA: hypothetical protein VIW29_22680 [Polyangiaceae bacterium]
MKPVWPILGVIGLSAVFAVTRDRMYAAPAGAEVEPSLPRAASPADDVAVAQDTSARAADSADEPSGEVLESQDVAGYTYLRLKTAAGEVWAAVPRASVKLHEQVRITGANLMLDFESKTLKRTFPKIYFGSLANTAPAPSAAPGPVNGDEALPPGHPPLDSVPADPYADGSPLPPGHPPIDSPRL